MRKRERENTFREKMGDIEGKYKKKKKKKNV